MNIRRATEADFESMWPIFLPKAFRHRELGLVDAYVMYRFLD